MVNSALHLSNIALAFRLAIAWLCLIWPLPGIAKGADEPAIEPVADYDTALAEEWQKSISPLIRQLCFDCHGESTQEASVDFSKFNDLTSVRSQPALWDQVSGLVKLGAMPPPDTATVAPEQRRKIADWIENALHRTDCSCDQLPGHVTIRRLNNTEYDNTIRDLLKLDFRPSQKFGFISDEVGNGFDNQGEVLSLPPLLMEKYITAAEYIAEQAIVINRESLRQQRDDGSPIVVTESFKSVFDFAQGKYTISAKIKFGEGQTGAIKLRMYVDDEEIAQFDFEPKEEKLTWDRDMTSGPHSIRLEYVADPDPPKTGRNDRRLFIEYLGIEGPHEGQPAYPPSHQSIMIAEPNEAMSDRAAAEAIFREFLAKAYRRPPMYEEVDHIVSIVLKARGLQLSFPESIQYGLQSALVSPSFLFRAEKLDGSLVRDGVRRLNDYDIATRLSNFMWSSLPDNALRRDAEQGKLADANVLSGHLNRMLADDRSSAVFHGFYAQWLGLRNLSNASPDTKVFPIWSERLRAAMMMETQLLCMDLTRNGGKLGDLLTSDFTYLNPRMAELYGMDFEGKKIDTMYLRGRNSGRRELGRRFVDEDRWVRTSLPENRRGILTQASVLTMTSNPTRTSPVKRGKWVLESILGDPPPAAPPGVPPLEATQKDHSNISLREQLEIHRANPSCASCHNVMDPIGLGLENFDSIGRWRDKDNDQPIIAAGVLADGSEFSGAAQLVQRLSLDKEKMARHFASMLLTYAIGRGLQAADQCAIDDIVAKAKESDYRIDAFFHAIIQSEPFLLANDIPKE